MKMNFLSVLLISPTIFLFRYGNCGSILGDPDQLIAGSNRTVQSPRGVFEAGFFKFAASESWYLGIWYKNIPERTYIWVANGRFPVLNSSWALAIYRFELVVRDDSTGYIAWSSGKKERHETSSEILAQLLDNGNLVLRDANKSHPEDYLWQSFDYPTNTIVPEMILRLNPGNFLKSWRREDDPTPGDFVFRFDARPLPVLSIWDVNLQVYRSGPWNGTNFIGVPALLRLWDKEQIPYLSIRTNDTALTRVQIDQYGILHVFTWSHMSTRWEEQWASFVEDCDTFRHCGPNEYCAPDASSRRVCGCIPGFGSRDVKNLTNTECVRKKNMSCDGDRFKKLANVNLPDLPNARSHAATTGNKECRSICTKDCTCTAYAVTSSLQTGTPSCFTWHGDLFDLRSYRNEGLELNVRVGGKKKSRKGMIIGLSVGIPAVVLFGLAILCYWKRKQKRATAAATMIPMEIELQATKDTLPQMDFGTILKATDSFSQEIGHGGFGNVYKGVLPNGEQIAVKKLSKLSKQGPDEFYTEVKSISRLRHVNIVRLYGWSVHRDEKLLIYEYLENGSLDRHLFGGELAWDIRYRIIKGFAQGLAYIEEGSHEMIVHRDLKPQNILLDKDMTPKISDFGLARMYARNDRREAITEHTHGTRAYMSPEYLTQGVFSAQSDIYSFGVTVLEIVSGRKNSSFSSHMGLNVNLVGYAWDKFTEGKWTEIVDEKLAQGSSQSWQLLRTIQVGLLCSQNIAKERPKMSMVVAMLEDEDFEVQKPKRPGFYPAEEGLNDIPSSSKTHGESSASTSYQYSNLFTEEYLR